MALPAEFIERLKLNNPIADVMGEYVSTKRAGRDYVCLCPFHNEKTPSCYIHPEREFFHCFGCGAGGDVITFIMKYRNLDYMESVRYLAERANMEMPLDSFGGAQQGTREKRARMYEMNKAAARFFYSQLSTEAGRECVRYLTATRGLRPETIKRYGMGFAPNSWSALKNHMMSLGYGEQELVDAGLISRSKNNTKKTFDFFVNRAMFPFIDLTGHIVGFGGRALSADDSRKYLNSRDTLVYNKNRFLFSMNIAKNAAVKDKRILLCEGNLDVISLTQAGFENAVASCGTALTPEQVRLISGYAEQVVICYDSDEAGRKASQKAIGLLSQAGLKTRVIEMRGAKDPDEYVRKFGTAAFSLLLDDADNAVDYKLKRAAEGKDMDRDADRLAYKDEAVSVLLSINSEVERDIYIQKVAEQLGVSPTVLRAEISSVDRRKYFANKRRETDEAVRFSNRRDPVNREASEHFREKNAEEMVISYLARNTECCEEFLKRLPPEKLVTSFNRRVYEFITSRISADEDWSLSAMAESFTDEECGSVARIYERCAREHIDRRTADECIEVLLRFEPPSSGDPTIDTLESIRAKKRKELHIM